MAVSIFTGGHTKLCATQSLQPTVRLQRKIAGPRNGFLEISFAVESSKHLHSNHMGLKGQRDRSNQKSELVHRMLLLGRTRKHIGR